MPFINRTKIDESGSPRPQIRTDRVVGRPSFLPSYRYSIRIRIRFLSGLCSAAPPRLVSESGKQASVGKNRHVAMFGAPARASSNRRETRVSYTDTSWCLQGCASSSGLKEMLSFASPTTLEGSRSSHGFHGFNDFNGCRNPRRCSLCVPFYSLLFSTLRCERNVGGSIYLTR